MTGINRQEAFGFVCHQCGVRAPRDRGFVCAGCGDPMALEARGVIPLEEMLAPPVSLWQYRALLPVSDSAHIVSLGEGGTPLLSAPRLAARFGMRELHVKNETVNPTGSFKDRQISVGISHAREHGKATAAVVSSGNVAASAAAYAARAGMHAVLFFHGQAGAGKMAQAASHGARMVRLDTELPSEAFRLCLQACATWGWAHLSTAGMYEPCNVEGAKTIAYELFAQFDGNLPDCIVAPVGGGGLLGGIWRGLLDMKRMGYLSRLPRMAGVQATGCAPLCQAMDQGWSFGESLRHPWPQPDTVAGGIADDVLFDGHTVLPAIRATGGAAIAVDDEAIALGRTTLAIEEGLLCETTSAVVIAALPQLAAQGMDGSVCCILTGHGLKDASQLASSVGPPTPIPASLESLAAHLGL